ncbi:MAG: hypothetical protein Fur0037_15960 [Planctomycetota bacterium]
MRLCPTVDGHPPALITHLIGADVCLSRQRGFYHKCHRCQYRGKPIGWTLPGEDRAPSLPAAAKPASPPGAEQARTQRS